MTTNLATRQMFYQTLAQFEKQYDALMVATIGEITAVLSRNTAGDTIPAYLADQVAGEAASILERKFTLPNKRVFSSDGVMALTPFAHLLNLHLAQITWKVAGAGAKLMEKRLTEDLQQWLKRATQPAATEMRVTEAVMIGNFIARYEPAHTWVDPNGYTLSRRIWRNSQEMRLRLDQMLTDGILGGRGALELARDLEAFLRPRRTLRTTKPYGSNASFYAMRLARTEITRAYGAVTLAAAEANPFVSGIDWKLSLSHPRMDICDALATISMEGARLKDPYGVYDVPRYPAHPHDLCVLLQVVTEKADDVIRYLRNWLNEDRPAPLTPLNKKRFVESLLGTYLTNLAEVSLL